MLVDSECRILELGVVNVWGGECLDGERLTIG